MRALLFHITILISLLSVCKGQQAPMSLDEIRDRLNTAQVLERELKVKTAYSYFESLIQPVDSLIKINALNSEYWKIQGLISAKTGSLEEAYESFRKSVVLDSTNLENQIEYIRFTLNTARNFANNGEQYKSQQWLQNSYDVLADAIRVRPNNHELHELAGDIYASTNDIENCTYHYQKAFDLKKDKEIALRLYRLYAVTRDYKNEVKMAGILSERFSTYPEYYAVQAELGIKNIESDFEEQSRYLPGVKRTLMMAIEYGSLDPDTYRNYFEIIKMGYAFDSTYQAGREEIKMVLNQASLVLDEIDIEKADILVNGAQLLKDLGFDDDACQAYNKAKALNTTKTSFSNNLFCK